MKQLARYYQHKATELLTLVARARADKAIPAQLLDIFVHKIRINTNIRDYYLLEFYKGGKTWEEKSRYIGSGGSRYYPYQNNSIKYLYLFNNKLVTKILLAGLGLPQPKLLAAIGHDYEIKNREQFLSFLDSTARDVVIKPLGDRGGSGVLVLRHAPSGWQLDGEQYSAEQVWKRIEKGWKDGYVAEERVRNNDQIAALYPHSLNTMRVVTIKTEDGRWHAARGALRLGTGGKSVDNVTAGGIIVYIDHDGTIFQAYDIARSQRITHHPDNGASLIGIAVEGYGDAVELGLQAARKLGFMGIIGWDIALTDRGPMIVEGNAFPGSVNWQRGVAGPWLTREMADGLKPRRPFSRWDKTKIYPGIKPHRIRA